MLLLMLSVNKRATGLSNRARILRDRVTDSAWRGLGFLVRCRSRILRGFEGEGRHKEAAFAVIVQRVRSPRVRFCVDGR
jgi:hypothetical protein